MRLPTEIVRLATLTPCPSFRAVSWQVCFSWLVSPSWLWWFGRLGVVLPVPRVEMHKEKGGNTPVPRPAQVTAERSLKA